MEALTVEMQAKIRKRSSERLRGYLIKAGRDEDDVMTWDRDKLMEEWALEIGKEKGRNRRRRKKEKGRSGRRRGKEKGRNRRRRKKRRKGEGRKKRKNRRRRRKEKVRNRRRKKRRRRRKRNENKLLKIL